MAFWSEKDNLLPKQQHRWIISLGQHDLNSTNTNAYNNLLPYYFAKSVERPTFSLKTQQAKYLYSHTFNFPTRVIWNPIKISFYDVIMENIKQTILFSPVIDSDGATIFDSRRDVSSGLTQQTFITRELNIKQSTQVFFYKFLQQAGYFAPEELSREDQLLRFRQYNFKKDMVRALVGIVDDKQNNADFFNPLLKIGNEEGQRYNTKNVIDTESFNSLQIKELSPDGDSVETWNIYNPLITDITSDRLEYSQDNVISISCTISYDYAELEPRTGDTKKEASIQQQQIRREVNLTIPPPEPSITELGSRGTSNTPRIDIPNRLVQSARSEVQDLSQQSPLAQALNRPTTNSSTATAIPSIRSVMKP